MPSTKPRQTQTALALSGQAELKPQRYKNYNLTETGPVITKDMTLRCPSHYCKEVKKSWKAIVPSLISMQVLSQQDLPALSIMFDCLEEYYAQMRAIRLLDSTYSNEEDYWEKRDKASKRRSKALDEWVRLACRFGILPTERTRLVPQDTGEGEEDILDVIVQG